MRLELTVGNAVGAERDIRVTAPDSTPLQAIARQLQRDFPCVADGLWHESRRLPFEVPLGDLDLPTGARLTTGATAAIGRPRALDPTDAVVRLHVVGGPLAGRIEALPAGETVIGRSTDCGLVLRDPRISRRHAAVTVDAAGVHVRDLGSTNGTRLDGVGVDRAGCRLRPDAHLQVGDSTLSVSIGDRPAAASRPGPDGTVLLQRGQRPSAADDESTLVEPAASARVRPQRTQLLTALLPALAGAAIALVTHQLLFLAFAVAGPVALLASMLIDGRRRRRDERRARAQRRQHRREAATELASRLAAEVSARRATHPDPAAVRRAATTRNTLVWSRARDDANFLEVRVGLGDQPSRLSLRRSDGAVSAAGTVASVPVTLSLRLTPIGICGPRATRLAIARWLVIQLAVLHSPADLSLALVGRGDAATWSWLRRLPHYQVATGPDANPSPPRPASADHATDRWTVLVIDDPSAADLTALARTFALGCPNQVTAIWLSADERDLPGTRAVSVVGDAGARLAVKAAAGPNGADDGHDRDGIADQVSLEWAQSVSRTLMPLRDPGCADVASLPDQCRLLELHDPVPHASPAVLDHWARGGRPIVTLGVNTDGPVTIDLVQDGPHVLVAGTTGAGKSELLRTLVTGLAITNSPAALSFILIDYKGGAAFADCARLPHTVGLVTDLDADLAQRALASLRAELRRREALLAAAGIADLESYRREPVQRRTPLGRLVIVVDEFATLADELPHLIGGLLAVARRGRSLGLHLVLATQRPAGAISPEIQANLALRIALRVTDPTESMAIIGSAAAAGIDQSRPGRAIVRTGAALREFQAARVGLPVVTHDGEVRIELLDDWGRPTVTAGESDERPSDLQTLIESMRTAVGETALTVPASPWLPPLPQSVTPSELAVSDSPGRITIGLLDEPEAQRQSPETIDLDEGAAVLIAGPARAGRTTALRTIADQATAQLTEAQLQLYVIDCGGGLAALAARPHCGAMLTQHEPDAIGRLVSRLGDEVAVRRRRAASDRASPTHPRLLLLIDGWENLVEAVDAVHAHEPGSILDGLLRLLREAPSSQLTIAITARSPNLTNRLTSSIQRTYSFADSAGLTPGRATRLPDGHQLQFAWPASAAADAGTGTGTGTGTIHDRPSLARPGPIYVRSLPDRVDRRDLTLTPGPEPARVVLGLGGDAAELISVDLLSGDGRWLIAGPARSGRTTVLVSMLHQLTRASIDLLVAAPAHSLLSSVAIDLGLAPLDPNSTGREPFVAPGCDRRILLIDDGAAFADQPLEAALLEFVASTGSGDRGVVVSARSDDPTLAYRGIAAAVRRSGTGVLLQPGPVEGELLGIRLPRPRAAIPAGRAVLVCDQADATARKHGRPALPIQVAY
jgi:S-DNA-T family DNA segregation ATPase FtsK/SpoIIIE